MTASERKRKYMAAAAVKRSVGEAKLLELADKRAQRRKASAGS